MSEGKIVTIEKVEGLQAGNLAPLEGDNGARLGLSSMLSSMLGARSMSGYLVGTEEHVYMVLIDDEPSCCESFGYLISEDDPTPYVGAELREVRLTDTSLNTETVQRMEHEVGSLDEGGIQFVDFVTERGTLQLAVYNAHNGYYGHSIVLTRDNAVLHRDTL